MMGRSAVSRSIVSRSIVSRSIASKRHITTERVGDASKENQRGKDTRQVNACGTSTGAKWPDVASRVGKLAEGKEHWG